LEKRGKPAALGFRRKRLNCLILGGGDILSNFAGNQWEREEGGECFVGKKKKVLSAGCGGDCGIRGDGGSPCPGGECRIAGETGGREKEEMPHFEGAGRQPRDGDPIDIEAKALPTTRRSEKGKGSKKTRLNLRKK